MPAQAEDAYARCLFNNWDFSLLRDDCRDTQLWTCADCLAAYKAWLCAAVFPRCQGSPSLRVPICRNTCFVRPGLCLQPVLSCCWASPAPPACLCSAAWLCSAARQPHGLRHTQGGRAGCVVQEVVRKCPVTNQFTCPLTDPRDYADGLGMCANSCLAAYVQAHAGGSDRRPVCRPVCNPGNVSHATAALPPVRG